MPKVLSKGTWRVTLNAENPSVEFDLSTDFASGAREIIMAGTLDVGAYVKIQRYMDEFTGYQDELNIGLSPKSVFKIDVPGAGYGIATYHKAGKLKFVLVGQTTPGDIKLSILK